MNTSDRVELRLRGPKSNTKFQRIDVFVNGEFIEFDEHSMKWQDFKGTLLIDFVLYQRLFDKLTGLSCILKIKYENRIKNYFFERMIRSLQGYTTKILKVNKNNGLCHVIMNFKISFIQANRRTAKTYY